MATPLMTAEAAARIAPGPVIVAAAAEPPIRTAVEAASIPRSTATASEALRRYRPVLGGWTRGVVATSRRVTPEEGAGEGRGGVAPLGEYPTRVRTGGT
jgi:hypothetical protein